MMPATAPTQSLKIERTYDCTPEEMWAAWTDPKQFAKWISPFPGMDAEVHELEARKGGRVRFTMRAPDGKAFPEELGVFEVYDPPRELVQYQANDNRTDVFAGHPMRMKARFEPVGGKTRLVFEVTGLPPEFPLDAARGGFGSCLDKLALVVERRAAAKPLRLERVFDATPADLWAAWTDPRKYAKWFNPAPIDLVIHEFDVRPGGRIRFDMPQPDGNPNPQEGVFHSLVPHRELVSGSPDKSFLLTVRFEPVDKARTRLTIEAVGVPPEYHQMATVGWNACLDKLARLVADV